MQKIINCTPHAVTVYTGTLFDPNAGHSVGGTPVLSFPPCGTVATAKTQVEPLESLEVDGITIPTCKRQFTSISPLPKEGDLFIVSAVYAQACSELGLDTSNLLSPYGIVKKNNQKVGCTGLVRSYYTDPERRAG